MTPSPLTTRARPCRARRAPLAHALACGALLAAQVAWAAPPIGGQVEPTQTTSPRLIAQASLNYPAEAAIEGLHGDVTVRVAVDAEGAVTDVEVLSGPEVFWDEARRAARLLRFEPALHDGVPVPVAVVVYFHFAPPPEHGPHGPTLEVVVHAHDPDREDTHARVTLDGADLARSAGQDLARTVSQVAGVTTAGGAADVSKPIIRGQAERRLLLLQDGVRHESQKWGPDHAPEIDPFAAGEITVIKGAAGPRYGPDAAGGVLLVTAPPMREVPGVSGKALLQGATNGKRGYGALRLDVAPAATPGLSMRLEGNYKRGAALTAPDYVLGNTGSAQLNLGAGLQYQRRATTVRLGWRRYDLRAGVFYGVRTSTPSDFRAQLEADRPVSADLWRATYAIDRPYQHVTHDRITLHTDTAAGLWTLQTIYAYQHNHRREFESVRASVTGPQYDFTLRTHSLDALARHEALVLGRGALTGGFGVQGVFQENVYRGYPLIPNHRAFGAGVFAFERLVYDRGEVEIGARYDHLSRTAYLDERAFDGHVGRDTLEPSACAVQDGVARCPSAWNTGSVSLGGLLHLLPDALDLKLDLSSASRFPSPDELYLNGTAPTFPVHALGTPDLGVETTWAASTTLGLRAPWLEGEISAHASFIDQFVYFAPDLGDDGAPVLETNIRGAWPRYVFRPIDALFYGADGVVDVGPDALVGLRVLGSLVRAFEAGTGAFLVGTPADRGRATLTVRPPDLGVVTAPALSFSADLVAKQRRVDPALDFAPAPDGYVLLGLAAETDLAIGRRALTVGVDVHNLLNSRWREYTSLLRYYADQPGRDVRVRVGLDF